jgi:hypothetical protein
MKLRLLHAAGLAALLATGGGCGDGSSAPEPPEGILSKDSFALLYAESQRIEAAGKLGMYRADDPAVRISAAYADLFARTGVSEERYRESFTWWFNHPDALPDVLARATDVLNDLERSDNGVQYLPAPLDTAAPTVTPGRTLRPVKPAQRGN